MIHRLADSLRGSARRLRRNWRHTAAVVFVLGLGIGPAAAMLSVVNRVLLRPLEYRDPEHLGLLRVDLGELRGHPGLSPAEAIDLRGLPVFSSVEVETRIDEVSYGPPDRLVPLSRMAVTTGMLPMLGVTPALGRNFQESDFPPPAPPTPPGVLAPPPAMRPIVRVLLDDGAWQRYFGGAADVVGQRINIDGGPAEIIGVLPRGFQLVTGRAVPRPVDVYMPQRLVNFRNAWQFPTLARLAPGMTFAGAQAALDTLSAANKANYPDYYDGRLRYTITPVLDDLTRPVRPALRAAVGAVLLLLVIALSNATALIVAQMKAREMDVAIRSAIGAARSALVLDVFTESLLLAAAGAAIGAAVATLSVAGIRVVMPRTVPRWDQIGVGWDTLAAVGALAATGLLLSGLVPIWKMSRLQPADPLRAGSVNRGARTDRALSRLILAGAQIAISVVLVFGCIQFVRSARQLAHVDLGYDANVLTLRVPYDFRRYPERKDRAALFHRIRDRVAEVPGVAAVGVVTHLPLSGSTMMDGYTADLSHEPSFDQSANYQGATPGYFRALKIPIVQGRDFTDEEDAAGRDVVIVDESLARTAFPGVRDVTGRVLRLGWGLRNSQIVGVVRHARTIEVGREVRPQVYAPISNLYQGAGFVTVRAVDGQDPMTLTAAVTSAIDEMSTGRAVSTPLHLTDNVTAATSTLHAVTWLLATLAISAALFSALGLYLVIVYLAREQRLAMAIRTALGASRGQVIWQHARATVTIILVAVAAGSLLTAAAAGSVRDLIYGVATLDALSLSTAAAIAALAAALGAMAPIARATRGDIVGILRGN